jgi:hypothetical protein
METVSNSLLNQRNRHNVLLTTLQTLRRNAVRMPGGYLVCGCTPTKAKEMFSDAALMLRSAGALR